MLRRSLAMIALFATLLSACAGGEGKDTADGTGNGTDDSAVPPEVDHVAEKMDFAIRATLSGDVAGTIVGNAQVGYVRLRQNSTEASDQSITGWELEKPLAAGGKAGRFSMTILPFRDNGTYRIAKGSRRDALAGGQAAKASSSVQVDWWPDGNPDGQNGVRFERRLEDCVVEIQELGLKGTLRCPQMVSEDGQRRARVELEWHKV